MIVRNWMKAPAVVVGSDMLLSEANRILSEGNLHGLPVVDDGRLRGLLSRANCLRAAHFVARTQNPDEFEFFSNRLRVRDLMVRNPATVDADDTMEACLQKGQELGIGQFPVMDGGVVVGMISANEIFALAAHFLGAWERRSGVTLAPVLLTPGTFGRIADTVERAGGEIKAIYPITHGEARNGHATAKPRKVVVRFHAESIAPIVEALHAAGFQVIESVDTQHRGELAAA